jgi:hypothetical protein
VFGGIVIFGVALSVQKVWKKYVSTNGDKKKHEMYEND